MWAVGVFDLRLSEPEFRRLTLRKYDLLVKRLFVNHEAQEYRTAKICASIFENGPRGKKNKYKHYEAKDFLPQKEVSQDGMLKKIENLNIIFGGTDIRNG